MGEARCPPAKRQGEEGEGGVRLGRQNGEGWQIRRMEAGGEKGNPRLQKLEAGECLLPLDTPGSVCEQCDAKER